MSTVRLLAGITALGIALATPGFAVAENNLKSPLKFFDFSSNDKDPAKDLKPSTGSNQSKFIYLDDGSDDESALKNVPARPAFRMDGRSTIDGNALGLKARKRPVLVLSPQEVPAFSAGIRVDGFGSTGEQRSAIKITPSSASDRKSRDDGLDVWLSTETGRSAVSSRALELALNPKARKSNYNVGVNVGYNGFTVGAALLREQSGQDMAYQGYDLGVGYLGHSWYTNLQVAGFRSDGNPLAYNFMGDSFRAVELGAGYTIWPGFTFSGRFKYFDYGTPLYVGGQGEDQHIFSLDTRLNF